MSRNNRPGISRREFLKTAGLLAGGVALGPVPLTAGCAASTTTTAAPGTTGAVTVTAPESPPPGEAVTLNVNGRDYVLAVKADWTLDFVLRDRLGLFGTKVGCGMGDCGSCTVLVGGVPALSCLMLAVECRGLRIETIEGLGDGLALGPQQQRFYDTEAFQCGFCTPGFIMAAEGLLRANPRPSIDEVRQALSGHICTCGNFTKTVAAITGGL